MFIFKKFIYFTEASIKLYLLCHCELSLVGKDNAQYMQGSGFKPRPPPKKYIYFAESSIQELRRFLFRTNREFTRVG